MAICKFNVALIKDPLVVKVTSYNNKRTYYMNVTKLVEIYCVVGLFFKKFMLFPLTL